MRPFIQLICLALLPALVHAGERGPAVPDYPADKIAENIYVIHGPLTTPNPENQGFMNNPGIVITGKGVVIIDPGSSVQSGEMVLRAVRKLSDKPVVAVFNSHIHGDHWLGNQAIRAAWPDAAIYGHPNMIALIEEGEGASWVELMEQLTEGKTAGTIVVAPDKPASHDDETRVGEFTFRIHNYGKSHTTSDIMVEIVEPGVVFLGDNVLRGRIPRMGDGDIQGNIKTCEIISNSSATIYVPGHGKTGGKELIDSMYNYFNTVYSNVKRLYDEGQSDFEMKDEISAKLKDYSGWIGFDTQLGKHISFAYLQIEADDF
jgi:glyoxylase-like metal-dependent hydrolase (beta-lactamase superfamily II)